MNIEIKLLSARSITFVLNDCGIYNTDEKYSVYLNSKFVKETDTVVNSLFHLKPDTDYELTIKKGSENVCSASFHTKYEFVTLNVKDFGAKGDGRSDDTKYIQAAILACPKDSRVLIPRGVYLCTSLFLKSDISIEIEKFAEIKAITKREEYVKLPSVIESYDEEKEYILGTWEGNPLPMFAAIIMGVNVSNVILYGEGVINGNASKDDWWHQPKVMRGAFRPRLFHINSCENIYLQGLTFTNSPSWTLHPFFSNNLGFYNLLVMNPAVSPNTDGLDPESCKNVEIMGVHFSLGDDCIAVKSGKIYMGKKYKTPSENILVSQCLMENGHGAVTIGSEMAGGVKNLTVKECLFVNTDRGLRIKTRRGRGEDAIIDGITFKNIKMDHVMTPFVVNAFYFCDPDGKIPYVQSREPMPVDDRTPRLKKFLFEDIKAENCYVAATWIEGLPECKVEEIAMRNILVTYAEDIKKDVPAMSLGVEASSKKGITVKNVKKLLLENVTVTGQEGDEITVENVDEYVRK